MRTLISFFLLVCALVAQQPYTSYIQPGVAWYTIDGSGPAWPNVTQAPSNPLTPRQLWRDNSVVWESQGAAWWEALRPLSSLAPRTYTVFVREADGSPSLTPIDSPEFLATYKSLSVINTYREFAFLFPKGVPYTKEITLPATQAGEMNFGGTLPATDYPVVIASNILFFVKEGKIYGQDYQEWLRANRPPPMSDEEKIRLTGMILARPDLSAIQKIQAIRQILIEKPKTILI